MRLDKLLAETGMGTRSKVKELIRKGKVTVNEKIIKNPDCRLTEEENGICEQVCVEGIPVHYSRFVYYMLNKPKGYISATTDSHSKTVLELVPSEKALFPVGRLDKDTEGLCILTNDGPFAHDILSPKRHVPKCYYVEVNGELDEGHCLLFQKGIMIRDKSHDEMPVTLMPAELKILCVKDGCSRAEVTICEGKYHQVKRMFAAVGCSVTYLKRLSIGAVELDTALKPGEYRTLTAQEIAWLRAGSTKEKTKGQEK